MGDTEAPQAEKEDGDRERAKGRTDVQRHKGGQTERGREVAKATKNDRSREEEGKRARERERERERGGRERGSERAREHAQSEEEEAQERRGREASEGQDRAERRRGPREAGEERDWPREEGGRGGSAGRRRLPASFVPSLLCVRLPWPGLPLPLPPPPRSSSPGLDGIFSPGPGPAPGQGGSQAGLGWAVGRGRGGGPPGEGAGPTAAPPAGSGEGEPRAAEPGRRRRPEGVGEKGRRMVGTAGGRGEAAGRRRRGEDGERSAALGPGLRARGGGEDPSLRRGSRGSRSFEVAFPDAAEKMKKVITQLKEAQACIPPCGLQEFARRFLCSGCYSRVCDLPLDCPVQDVTVIRGDQAMFSCIVNFQLPKEEITYSWKFAGGGLRTQDLSYFRDMPRAEGYLARIRPAQLTHRGTFSCVIKQDQRPLARLYFFLNVTGPPPRAETELQASFREVLRWAPRDAELIQPWRPSLGELLVRPEALTPSNLFLLAALGALASASATVLAWIFFRWYCSGD
ncbi:sperm acrosome membrane-associated protein 6 isoform X3 [Macaca mulatta]